MLIFMLCAFAACLSVYLHTILPAMIVSGGFVLLWTIGVVLDEVEKSRRYNRRPPSARRVRRNQRRIARTRKRMAERHEVLADERRRRRGF
jgi:hypothetical protein